MENLNATVVLTVDLQLRALSAFLSHLDVAKTRLQAQAVGDFWYSPLQGSTVLGASSAPSPEFSCYKRTMDAYTFFEVTREEGYARLWRGTNASLALTVPCVGIYLPCYDILRNSMDDSTIKSMSNLSPPVPLVAGSLPRSFACITCYPVEPAKTNMQAVKKRQSGVEPPGIWNTLQDVIDPVGSTKALQNESFVAMNIEDFDEQMCAGISSISEVYEKPYLEVQNLRTLWSGLGAQLARDVPFYAICWATLEPMRRRIVGVIGDEASIGSVVGANFLAGLFAGSVAAAATYPLDVAKMRRQLQKDDSRASRMKTLIEMWRCEGVKGMYKGVGGRVGRAGLSVGIVVSFYQTTKYIFYHRRRSTSYK